ncbi:hypothetical protein [Nocardioides sp.]|uniref:hypothetical protein n=1 Tax=Nocardioides sp. TaxID=35761 RepID=UPI0035165EA2
MSDSSSAPGSPSGTTAPRDEDPGSPTERALYPTSADLAEHFDVFYRNARERLLLQTFALTGDLASARGAVREAMVVAWHHWRKADALDDPEMYVRPLAWRLALRRSSRRPLRRRRDLDADTRRVLDALGSLTLPQRRALLLTQLAAVTMEEMAHEVGLPLEAAERELQHGAAHLAMQLEIPTASIPLVLSGLTAATGSVVWPRASILRRAGSARRRTHTVIGSAVAITALVAGGALSLDTAGARPTLAREGIGGGGASSTAAKPAAPDLPRTALLAPTAVDAALRAPGWQEITTTDNSAGNGLVLPCQGARYADPRGTAAWLRGFRDGPEATAKRRVLQFAEASAAEPAAERTFRRTVEWFSACTGPVGGAAAADAEPPRTQLVSTAEVAGVGDRAVVLVLRSQNSSRTNVVGVARTGVFTVTVSLGTTTPAARVRRDGVARLLAAAVAPVCRLDGGGACVSGTPRVSDVSAFPVGEVPWMLSEVDLPPLSRDQGPWVGTPVQELTEQRADAGAIGCDTASLFREYRGQTIRTNQFRTFVLSTAPNLPPEVGLTQTVGALPEASAQSFVRRLRAQIDACPDSDASAGTEVRSLDREVGDGSALAAWRLTTALPGDRTVEYDVAVVRRGTSVSLLVYVAAPAARIADADFVALARRAQERLERLRG